MVKLYKGFFKDKDVLFVGYSSRNSGYSKGIYKAFTDNGIRVYPYNIKENAQYDVKVYKRLSELPVVPQTAFVLLNTKNASGAVMELIDKGVKRILFRSKVTADQATLEACDKAGVETAYGCPMMLLGSGLHKIHAVLAGVK